MGDRNRKLLAGMALGDYCSLVAPLRWLTKVALLAWQISKIIEEFIEYTFLIKRKLFLLE